MKKLIFIIALIIAAFLLGSCGNAPAPEKTQSIADMPDTTSPPEDTPDQPGIVVDDPTTPVTVTPSEPESPEQPEIQVVESDFVPNILIMTDSAVYLSDGNAIETLVDQPAKYVGPRLLMIGFELIEYDATGDGEVRYVFDQKPAQALENGSIYSCVETDPDTAQSLGAQAKWYSEFFKDNVSLGFWALNQMRCTDLIGVGENVWNIDENGSPQLIDGTASGVEHIQDPDFYIYSLDIVNKRISFNEQAPQDYALNYILAAKQWQFYDGLWYSENGYTWSEVAGLSEAVNVMDGWNEQPFPVSIPIANYPTLIAAGVHDGLLYWIEANTGWLISFNPGIDEMNQVYRLYEGDGLTATGEAKQLQPVMAWPYVYFFDSVWYQLDMETGFTSLFYAGSVEVERW